MEVSRKSISTARLYRHILETLVYSYTLFGHRLRSKSLNGKEKEKTTIFLRRNSPVKSMRQHMGCDFAASVFEPGCNVPRFKQVTKYGNPANYFVYIFLTFQSINHIMMKIFTHTHTQKKVNKKCISRNFETLI
jgi:hypothetical protein